MSFPWLGLGLLLALMWPVLGALAPTAETEVAEELTLARPRDGAPPAPRAERLRSSVPCRRRHARHALPRLRPARRTARAGQAHPNRDLPPDPDAH